MLHRQPRHSAVRQFLAVLGLAILLSACALTSPQSGFQGDTTPTVAVRRWLGADLPRTYSDLHHIIQRQNDQDRVLISLRVGYDYFDSLVPYFKTYAQVQGQPGLWTFQDLETFIAGAPFMAKPHSQADLWVVPQDLGFRYYWYKDGVLYMAYGSKMEVWPDVPASNQQPSATP